MIKALIIVSALGGGVNHTTEMPNMKTCLDARTSVLKQDPQAKVLCVPKEDDNLKIQGMFEIFMELIDQIKEMEAEDEVRDWYYNDYSRTEDCERPFGALECEG